MKKFFTFLLFVLPLLVGPLHAQDVDESYVFLDENGNVIENGATVVRNVVEQFDEESEVIYSGISVKNVSGTSSDFIRMNYAIEEIDNGTYQICFPTTCNMQTEPGAYETGIGQLMGTVQDIQSEWFPTDEGECIVTLSIEILTKQGLFPPTYIHKADGPTITLKFVKESAVVPIRGDVNGDREVNIADVNAIIDRILTGVNDKSGDVNNDGEVNIADVNVVIDIILNT